MTNVVPIVTSYFFFLYPVAKNWFCAECWKSGSLLKYFWNSKIFFFLYEFLIKKSLEQWNSGIFLIPVCCNQINHHMWLHDIFSLFQSLILVNALLSLFLLFRWMLTWPFSESFRSNHVMFLPKGLRWLCYFISWCCQLDIGKPLLLQHKIRFHFNYFWNWFRYKNKVDLKTQSDLRKK